MQRRAELIWTFSGIEVAQLNSQELEKTAKKTKVLISTIGPFAKHGESVVEACVKSKTHYFDMSVYASPKARRRGIADLIRCGETPFTFEMLHKYNERAKQNGVVVGLFPILNRLNIGLLAKRSLISIRSCKLISP